MHRFLRTAALAATLMLTASAAYAWHVDGHVYCGGGGLPLANVTVVTNTTDGGAPWTGQAVTDEFGYYFISLPDVPRCFNVAVVLGPGGAGVNPASGSYDFCTTDTDYLMNRNFVISTPACGQAACWMTGGGAKFESVDGLRSGTNGPDDTWGGNVNPGCSPTAGDGGSWNHVSHAKRLHFHGQAIQVVRCGNVDGIPPGSTSPVTPYNFIEYTGTGTLKGIQGNKADFGTVYFWAHVEDRNEPGSNGQRIGAGKDRYFLKVYTNPADPNGSTVLLIDNDGDPNTMDPITVTDGNLQLHISSCATPAPAAAVVAAASRPVSELSNLTGVSHLWFAAAAPSPAQSRTLLRFGLPQEADVHMVAYDVTGRAVHTFAAGRLSAGEHSFDWNLRSDAGMRLSAGVYFVRLVVDGQAQSRAVVIQT
jgi:hypothetical protein